VLEVRRLAPDRAELVAEVRSVFKTVSFRVVLTREDFYELWREDVRAQDDLCDFDSLVDPSEDGRWLLGGAPLGEGLAADEVSELRIGREWKIDAFELIDADRPAP